MAAIYISNTNGTLTAYAVGAAPTVAMTLQVTVLFSGLIGAAKKLFTTTLKNKANLLAI